MGHYYSEMCCPKCGRIPCKCHKAAKVEYVKRIWVLDSDDYTIWKGDEFLAAKRRHARIYDSKEAAEKDRIPMIQKELKECDDREAALRDRVAVLKKLLENPV